MWILSLIGISFRGGAVSYGLFAVLTLIPFFSLLYLFAVYILFHIYQNIERRYVTVNEPVRYRFSLVNECPMVFAGIRVKFFSSFSSRRSSSSKKTIFPFSEVVIPKYLFSTSVYEPSAAETAAAAEIRSAVNLIKTIHLPTLQIRTVRRE